MSPAVPLVAVIVAGLVFVARLAVNLRRARTDGRIAARHAEPEQQR
jgi:hypothetical protein